MHECAICWVKLPKRVSAVSDSSYERLPAVSRRLNYISVIDHYWTQSTQVRQAIPTRLISSFLNLMFSLLHSFHINMDEKGKKLRVRYRTLDSPKSLKPQPNTCGAAVVCYCVFSITSHLLITSPVHFHYVTTSTHFSGFVYFHYVTAPTFLCRNEDIFNFVVIYFNGYFNCNLDMNISFPYVSLQKLIFLS